MSFLIEELASGAIQTITYTLGTDASKMSIRQFFDGGEDGDDIWLYIDEDNETNRDIWALTEEAPRTGEFSWHIVSDTLENRQTLRLDEPFRVSGNFPTLRFYHDYETEPGFDAGLVEISTDDGFNWVDAGPLFIRNDYVGDMAYGTFAEANRNGFWGDSNGFIPSYVDLRSFIGQDIILRFRYGTDRLNPTIGTDSNGTPIFEQFDGWRIDDVEYLDLLSYNGQACLSVADSGGEICAIAPEGGTFIEVGQMSTAVDNLEDSGLVFTVFPNPAGDYLNIRLSQETSDNGTLSLFNANGQQLQSQAVQLNANSQLIPLNVSQLPGGFYFVEVRTGEGVAVKKVILE